MGLGVGGGFFGSGGKSKSGNTKSSTRSSVANVDLAHADGFINSLNLGTTSDSDISVNITDGGAIAAMLQVTQGNNDIVAQNNDLARNFVSELSRQNSKQLASVESLAKSVNTGGQTVVADSSVQIIKYISIGAAVVGLVYLAGQSIKAKSK